MVKNTFCEKIKQLKYYRINIISKINQSEELKNNKKIKIKINAIFNEKNKSYFN